MKELGAEDTSTAGGLPSSVLPFGAGSLLFRVVRFILARLVSMALVAWTVAFLIFALTGVLEAFPAIFGHGPGRAMEGLAVSLGSIGVLWFTQHFRGYLIKRGWAVDLGLAHGLRRILRPKGKGA